MSEPVKGRRDLPPPRRPYGDAPGAGRLRSSGPEPSGATELRDWWRRSPAGTVELLIFALLALALWAGYSRTDRHVSLTVDGRYAEFVTRSPTVADLLVELKIAVGPSDLVVPNTGSRLVSGTHVWIQRARTARIRADGRWRSLETHGRSVEDVLASIAVTLGPNDRVHVNDELWPALEPAPRALVLDRAIASIGAFALPSSLARAAEEIGSGRAAAVANDALPGQDSTWTLEVFRATTILLVDDNVPQRVVVAGPTVAESLRSAGIPVYEADLVSPSHDALVEPDMRVIITRATPFTLDADGDRREARALAATVGEAVELSGVALSGRDYSIPGSDQPLTTGLEVRVIRVAEDIQIDQVPIPYGRETVADPSMNLDSTRVDRAGSTGLKTVRTKIVYENGLEIDREVLEEVVDVAPVSEILAYGTNVVWGTVDTTDGPRQYWRKMRVYATSYSASRAGTPKSAPWYGRTRLGWIMRKGIVSVDPNVIPMSTYMYVAGYGIGQAGDTGGGVRRYHIDLGYDDDNYESWHQYVDVYLLDPLPPDRDMTWILP